MRHPSLAGVVLAAGLGRRFGGGKLDAHLEGRPIVEHVLDAAQAAMETGELASVLVVVGTGPSAGPDAGIVRALAASRGFEVIDNEDPAAGLSRSIRLALAALEPTTAEGALVLLGDQPRVRTDVIRALADRWRAGLAGIVIPRYQVGGPGNPVILDRSVWALAAGLGGDTGMIAIARERPDLVAYVDADGANPDVDTRAELDALGSTDP